MNENVLEARQGATDVAVVVDMTTQKFGGALSGFVPEGNYALVAASAEQTDQKGDKTGKNWHITWETVAPEGFEGVRIETYHPIPVGDPSSEEYQKRQRNLQDMIASYASGKGQLDEIRGKRDAKITPAWLTAPDAEGNKKRFFALTRERDYKGRKMAEVAFYIEAKEFAERPGPRKGANPAATSSTETPDLLGGETSSGGNGTSAPASGKSAVDDALGL